MGKVKSDALAMIEAMPDDATWDEIKYRVFLRDAVEAGLADAEAGRVVSAEEAKRRIKEWLASPGPTRPSTKSN